MRTKHIFTAMVLPALFAACTADDFEVVNNGTTDSQRPMLSGVTLNVVGDADTRYAVDDNGSSLKFTYESGDRIGASIIDNVGTNVNDPSTWDVQYYQNGISNPFVYDARTDSWSAINSIGVGHYIFMYPYSEENINRKAVSYNLPVIQELYDEDGTLNLNAAIAKGNQSIYSDLLLEDDLVVDAYMRNLFAYPTFRINIDNGVRVNTVSQIVLEYVNATNNEGFVVKSGLNHDAVWQKFSDEDTKWAEVQTNDLLLNGNDASVKGYIADYATSPYLIAKFPEGGVEFGRDANTNNKIVEVRFMIPGADLEDYWTTGADGYDENKPHLAMHIYTDNGIYTIDDVYSAIVFNKTTDNDLKERVFARNTSYTLNLDKSKVHVGEDSYIVTTVEDWNNLVDEYGASKNYTGSNALEVKIIGDGFSFNNEVEFPSVATFKVTTDVKVTGNVTIKNVNVENNTVTVEKGATLTTTESFVANKIENKGTLNITKVLNDDDEVAPYEVITEIVNKGTLNVEEDAEASFELTNEEDATVTNNGDITINGSNNGTITNNGQISTDGDFENLARDYNKNKLVNEPKIENNGVIRSIGGVLTNKSLIVNNGNITCKSLGGTISNESDGTNPGTIDSKKDAVTYITNNAGGEVIVYVAVPNDDVVITDKNGDVVYTATAAKEDFKSGSSASIVTYVIAEGNLEFANMGNVKKLDINEAATLKLPATDNDLQYVNVNADLTLASSLKVTSKLTVATDVTLKVNNGVNLTVKTMQNSGLISVAGTFEATDMAGTEPAAGLVEESGNNEAQVIWGKSDAVTTKATYQTALNAAVKAWAEDDRELSLTVNNVSYNLKGQTADKKAASALFAEYYEANKGKTGFEEQTGLETAYNAYKAAVPGATLTEGYNAAVTELMKHESEKTFTEMVKGLTYTIADTDIYETAAEALEGFKAAVAKGTVPVTEQLDKVVLCTSTTNYAPEQSQIMKSDVIYTIFGDEAINLVSDWKSILGRAFDHSASNASAWDVDVVKDWISRVASTTNSNSSLILEAAKDFITTNNLLQASRAWKYTPKQIQAILLAQEYNK